MHGIVTRRIAVCRVPRFPLQASSGHEEVVRELVGAGADVNGKNDKGITPLFVFPSPVPMCYNNFGTQTLCSVEIAHRGGCPFARSVVLYSISIKIGRFLISRGADVSHGQAFWPTHP